MKQKNIKRDYNEYAKRNTVKVKVRRDKPLKYAAVFGFSLLMLICMMLPFSKVYVYEGEPDKQLGILGLIGAQAVEYPLNTYRILRWTVESMGGGGGGVPSSKIDAKIIINWIDNEGIEKLIFGNNTTVKEAIPHITTIVVIGTVLIALQLAQFILSAIGLVGANKPEYYLNVITAATVAIAVAWVVVTSLFNMSGRILFGIANFSIIFSYGTPLILVLAAGSAASAFLIKK